MQIKHMMKLSICLLHAVFFTAKQTCSYKQQICSSHTGCLWCHCKGLLREPKGYHRDQQVVSMVTLINIRRSEERLMTAEEKFNFSVDIPAVLDYQIESKRKVLRRSFTSILVTINNLTNFIKSSSLALICFLLEFLQFYRRSPLTLR